MGLPVVLFAFGDAAFDYAILFTTIVFFLHCSFGIIFINGKKNVLPDRAKPIYTYNIMSNEGVSSNKLKELGIEGFIRKFIIKNLSQNLTIKLTLENTFTVTFTCQSTFTFT